MLRPVFIACSCFALLLNITAWLPAAETRQADAKHAAAQKFERIDLFECGQGGYASYRIPGIVVTQAGTVLAYAEARKAGHGDWEAIDLLLCRSTDGGKTWSKPQQIGAVEGDQPRNPIAVARKLGRPSDKTYNNAVAIADRTGAVHLVYCLDYYRSFYIRSDDDGITWTEPVEITSAFEKIRSEYDWKILATGPAHGIQLRSGRLLVPVWLSLGTGGNAHRPSIVTTLYSDDAGKTWEMGEIAVPNTSEWINPNESIVAERDDGRVMLNVRNESTEHRRLVTYSHDGATGWTKPEFHAELLEPICMAGLARVSSGTTDDKSRLVFSNPHNLKRADGREQAGRPRDRVNLSIKLSYDEGQTWPVDKVLEPGFSAYSDLAVLPDGTILCFYERGRPNQGQAFHGMSIARFNVAWLTDGADHFQREPVAK